MTRAETSLAYLQGYVSCYENYSTKKAKIHIFCNFYVQNSEDEKFKEHKKFAVSTLSDMGFGKSPMEDIILEEGDCLFEQIQLKATNSMNNIVKVSKMYSPATFNVVWRFATGKQSKQDDPELINLIAAGKEIFMFFSVDSLLKMIQLYNVWVSRLCQWIGYKANVFDVPANLQQMLYREAESGQPDSKGSFVERHWFMQEKLKDNMKSVFSGRVGMDNLKGALWDMFLAGMILLASFFKMYAKLIFAF